MTALARIVSVGPAPPSALEAAEGAEIAAALEAAGLPVASRIFVEADEAALGAALAAPAALTVIVADAGAGDAVRRVVARMAGARLALSERMLGALEAWYRRGDRPLPRSAERLALLPQGASVWALGEAEPAWAVEIGSTAFVAAPRGECQSRALAERLAALVRERVPARETAVIRTLRVAGSALAEVEERLGDLLGREGEVLVMAAAAPAEVHVRLVATAAAAGALAAVEGRIREILGADCYGADGESLERVVGRLLLEQTLTLSVAESCTGGLVGHRLTNVPGSSAYFERGVVVYSNRAKQDLLGVPEAVLRAHGAVSAPCAEAMARGIAERSGSACALGITGVAGPEGGTPGKPVGTVFIGLSVRGEVGSRRFRFAGDRAAVKWQASHMALDVLRRRLGEDDARAPGGVR